MENKAAIPTKKKIIERRLIQLKEINYFKYKGETRRGEGKTKEGKKER